MKASPSFKVLLSDEGSRSAAERLPMETRMGIDERVDGIRDELEICPNAFEVLERARIDLKNDLQGGFDDFGVRLEDELETGRKQIRAHPRLAVMAGVSSKCF
jgi:hypothetical protein